MPLKEQIRSKIVEATKQGKAIEKNVLKVVLGEIETQETRVSKSMSDEDIIKVVRKTLLGIDEMLQYKKDDATLLEEKAILGNLVPKQLSEAEISEKISAKLQEIKSAKSDGQATGIVMKFCKENGLSVDGTTVATVVKKIRMQ